MILVALVCAGLVVVESPAQAKQTKDNPRYASLVMDADTGEILHERYSDKPLHPASLTKMMTLLLLFEAIENKQISLNDRIPISKHAAAQVPSKLDLPAGSSIRVKDAILALVTKSANDIAVAVAEQVGGSEYNFSKMMNRKAREIGMNKSIFVNASGLHDPKQISSARDMSKLARHIIQVYPSYYRYFSTENFSYRGKNYHNHNRLMSTYKGMDGMKTGYVAASGFNLVASAVRDNQRLIGVVFGGRSTASRNEHMAKLLDQAFAKKRMILLADGDSPKGTFKQEAKKDESPIELAYEPEPLSAPPVPSRKPQIANALAALSKIAPANGLVPLPAGAPKSTVVSSEDASYKWVRLDPLSKQGMFSRLIGEGDSDPEVSKRIETGLIAINALKEEDKQSHTSSSSAVTQKVAYAPPAPTATKTWAIQVGAFTSRAATDEILTRSMAKLPQKYASARPIIAPLQTTQGWVFRARLAGYTREEAAKACMFIPDCLIVAPQNF